MMVDLTSKIGPKSFMWNIVVSDVDNIVERVANIMTAEDEHSLTKSWRSQFEEYVESSVKGPLILSAAPMQLFVSVETE